MVEIPDFSTLRALGIYGLTVVFGFVHHGFVFYPTLLLILQSKPIKFFKAIAPAQLLASRQVHAATLL
jgi:Na+/H+-dicarboxylate symporter